MEKYDLSRAHGQCAVHPNSSDFALFLLALVVSRLMSMLTWCGTICWSFRSGGATASNTAPHHHRKNVLQCEGSTARVSSGGPTDGDLNVMQHVARASKNMFSYDFIH